MITPEDYGAVGDGVTDDTTAVNNASAAGPIRCSNTYAVNDITIQNNITGKGSFVPLPGASLNSRLVQVVGEDIRWTGVSVDGQGRVNQGVDVATGSHRFEMYSAEIKGFLAPTAGLAFGLIIRSDIDDFVIDGTFIHDVSLTSGGSARGILISDITNLDKPPTGVIQYNRIEHILGNALSDDADGIVYQSFSVSGEILICDNEMYNCQKRSIKDQVGGLIIKRNAMQQPVDDRALNCVSLYESHTLGSVLQDNYMSGIFDDMIVAFGSGFGSGDYAKECINNVCVVPTPLSRPSLDAFQLEANTPFVKIVDNDVRGTVRIGLFLKGNAVLHSGNTFEQLTNAEVFP